MGAAVLAEVWLAAGLLLGSGLLGWLLDSVALGVLAGSALYLGWHLRNLWRLLRCVGGTGAVPESVGLWGELYERLYQARREASLRHRRLAQLVQRYEESSAALPDAAVALGPDHVVQWCNEAAQRYLGLSVPRDLGQRVTNVVRHPAFTAYVSQGEYAAPVEFPAPTDDNLVLQAQMVAYGHRRRLLVVRDVTHVRRLEQVRRDFVANASHELRTPLTVIYGFIESLHGEQERLPERWRRPIELLRQQAVRMQRIVDDMLMLARLEAEHTHVNGAEVNVSLLLAQVRAEGTVLSGTHGHRIELTADGTLWLRGNEAELRSAFSNLVANAVQHTPDGSRIEIEWCDTPQGACLTVRDNGEGIAPEHLPRLTERFYRVDTSRSRSRGGTGLGLAIVKHVVGRHGGELLIESTPGAGSTFTCRFPPALSLRRGEAPAARSA